MCDEVEGEVTHVAFAPYSLPTLGEEIQTRIEREGEPYFPKITHLQGIYLNLVASQ